MRGSRGGGGRHRRCWVSTDGAGVPRASRSDGWGAMRRGACSGSATPRPSCRSLWERPARRCERFWRAWPGVGINGGITAGPWAELAVSAAGGLPSPGAVGRHEDLRLNLAEVHDRIAAAAAAAGRAPGELTLVAVSKTWPAADVVVLCGLGVTDFAENREQEARLKVADVTKHFFDSEVSAASRSGSGDIVRGDRAGGPGRAGGHPPSSRSSSLPVPLVSSQPSSPLCWHFVGRLQRNKARSVTRWAHWVQSVDRAPLVTALSTAAVAHGREIVVCLQVSLDSHGGDVGRGGASPADIPALGDLVAGSPGLVLAGVMGVAPRDVPARPAFAGLREVSDMLRREHPDASVISAGMSGDLAVAVAEGATHLRIGTALFGQRRGVP